MWILSTCKYSVISIRLCRSIFRGNQFKDNVHRIGCCYPVWCSTVTSAALTQCGSGSGWELLPKDRVYLKSNWKSTAERHKLWCRRLMIGCTLLLFFLLVGLGKLHKRRCQDITESSLVWGPNGLSSPSKRRNPKIYWKTPMVFVQGQFIQNYCKWYFICSFDDFMKLGPTLLLQTHNLVIVS